MIFATVEGLAEWAQKSEEELRKIDPALDRTLGGVETRLMAYIFTQPNADNQKEAFTDAIYIQYMWEQRESVDTLKDLPNSITSFSTGNFSVQFNKLGSDAEKLFPAGLSAEVQALLTLNGLMYRGVY